MKKLILVICIAAFSFVSAKAGVYSDDWKAFEKEIDKEYPFFDLKGIKSDWSKGKREWKKRADACKDDGEFLKIISEAMGCLRDAHAGISESREPLPKAEEQYSLPLALMPGRKKEVMVMAHNMSEPAVKELIPGTIIKSINGKPARKLLDDEAKKLWEGGGIFSSPQRAGMLAYRLPLSSEKVSEHTIVYIKEGKAKTIKLKNDQKVQGWAHVYRLPKGLKRGEGSVLYGQLPSGAGYMYLRRIQGEKTTEGVAKAIKEYPSAAGWIVDLRGNGGGGYGKDLQDAFASIEEPVVVIIDAGCISAGETLARDLKTLAGAKLFGSQTAGSSSAKRTWKFPSGVATLILSTRSRAGLDKKPIEFNGIAPDVVVDALPEEVLKGLNSEILKAEEYLKKTKG